MRAKRRRWKVRLTTAAESDFADIVSWTKASFGRAQTRIYRDVLLAAIDALADGPEFLGSKAKPDVRRGLRTLHVARNGRRGRHVLWYRSRQSGTVEVLRILHDSMDLARHVPDENDQS